MTDFMDSFGLLVMATLLAFIVGVAVTIPSVNAGWRDDCEALGAHRFGDKVYDCKPRERAK